MASHFFFHFALLNPAEICDVWRLLKNADIKMEVSRRKRDTICVRNIIFYKKKNGK